MRPVKWVQSIECGDDVCFIYILLFIAWRKIFLLFLSLCLMVFRTSPRPFRGHFNILEVLVYCSLLVLMMSCLYFPEDLLSILSEVYSFDIGLRLLVLVNQVSKIFTTILTIVSAYIYHHKSLDAIKHKILLVNFLNNGNAWMGNWLT